MSKQKRESSYNPIGWQNHDRRLTREEFAEIGRRISGLHFSKEAFSDDPIALQLLFCAEALERDLRMLADSNPFPETEE
jgi:hypothetical protein